MDCLRDDVSQGPLCLTIVSLNDVMCLFEDKGCNFGYFNLHWGLLVFRAAKKITLCFLWLRFPFCSLKSNKLHKCANALFVFAPLCHYD